MSEGLLADKVVLVTGASTGIGAEAARLFAREGARVVLTARSAERLAEVTGEITATGGEASHVAADIKAASDVERVVGAVLERHGRLDGAFNNAGVSQGGDALADLDEERFDRVLAVNVKGVWLEAVSRDEPSSRGGVVPGAGEVAHGLGSGRCNCPEF